jgi:hypothetical protein
VSLSITGHHIFIISLILIHTQEIKHDKDIAPILQMRTPKLRPSFLLSYHLLPAPTPGRFEKGRKDLTTTPIFSNLQKNKRKKNILSS